MLPSTPCLKTYHKLKAAKTLGANLNAAELLAAARGYLGPVGSLTRLGEGVRWQVLKQPVEVSKAQIAAFRKLYNMNARPVQPLNDRKVEEN